MTRFYHRVSLLAVAGISIVYAQYPDSIAVPVTFYDFHADGTNPEFNPDHQGGVYTNMVAENLDAEKKPALGSQPFFNYFIAKWFRPWTPGDFTIPVYTDTRGTYGGTQTATHDTAFKNLVIQDTLIFQHIGNGQYQYENLNFFLLDGRGFGNEPTAASGYSGPYHNYSFTMELHWNFRCQEGQTFAFRGDDDVWAFVGNRLVMDLGGIHADVPGSFNVANFPWLEPGKDYDLDLFYAERHAIASTIRITSNIFFDGLDPNFPYPPDTSAPDTSTPNPITPRPVYAINFFLTPDPPAAPGNLPISGPFSINAGEQIKVYAHVAKDSTIMVPEYDSRIEGWGITGVPASRYVLTPSGNEAAFSIFAASSGFSLFASIIVPETGARLTGILKGEVLPSSPQHITMESSTPSEIWSDSAAVNDLRLELGNFSAQVYAAVRDQFGNWVSSGIPLAWSSTDSTVARVEAKTNTSEAVIGGIKEGTCIIIVQAPDNSLLGSDSVVVTVGQFVLRARKSLKSGISRDMDGNGLIDAIEVTYEAPVVFPADLSAILIRAECHDTVFDVLGIDDIGIPAMNHLIRLGEIPTDADQSSWKIALTIRGITGAADVDSFLCTTSVVPAGGRDRSIPAHARKNFSINSLGDGRLVIAYPGVDDFSVSVFTCDGRIGRSAAASNGRFVMVGHAYGNQVLFVRLRAKGERSMLVFPNLK